MTDTTSYPGQELDEALFPEVEVPYRWEPMDDADYDWLAGRFAIETRRHQTETARLAEQHRQLQEAFAAREAAIVEAQEGADRRYEQFAQWARPFLVMRLQAKIAEQEAEGVKRPVQTLRFGVSGVTVRQRKARGQVRFDRDRLVAWALEQGADGLLRQKWEPDAKAVRAAVEAGVEGIPAVIDQPPGGVEYGFDVDPAI